MDNLKKKYGGDHLDPRFYYLGCVCIGRIFGATDDIRRKLENREIKYY